MEQLVSTGRAQNCEQLLTYQLPESAPQVPELRGARGGPTPSAVARLHIKTVYSHYRTIRFRDSFPKLSLPMSKAQISSADVMGSITKATIWCHDASHRDQSGH